MREVTICAPAAQTLAHPKVAAKAAAKNLLHLVRKPVQHAHRELARTLQRHAYLAPKAAAHAKVAVVCTVVGVGGGLGAGIAAGGGVPPTFVPITQVTSAPSNPGTRTTHSTDPTSVPEPSSLLLLGVAGAGLAWARRRQPAN